MMMKKSESKLLSTLFGLVGLCALVGFSPTASAIAMIAVPSRPILMIDGSGDGSVDLMVFDASTDFNFGFYSGGFTQILSASSAMGTWTFAAGDVVDFAIQNAADSTLYRLSDGTATLDFTGLIGSGSSLTPIVPFDYWGNLTINWSVGNSDFVVRISGGDGFAAPIPEPTAALTFAAGLMLAGVRIRRQRQV